MSSELRRFPSKVDAWLVAVLVLPIGMAVLASLDNLRQGMWVPTAVLLVLQAVGVWPLVTTGYATDAEQLYIRCTFMRQAIPLRTIRALRGSRSPLSAPALSLDRIEVQHDAGITLVSPRDKEGFIDAVRQGAPHVRLEAVPGATVSADLPPAPRTGLAALAVIPAFVVVCLVLIGYTGTRPPAVTFDRDTMRIKGMSEARIPRGDIVGVSLESAMPKARKRFGYDTRGTLRGTFVVDGLGTGKVFVQRDTPPYVLVRMRDSFVYVNYADPERTRALYAAVREFAAHTAAAN